MSNLLPLSVSDYASERTRTASSFQFVHDQIDILRRQVATAVERGSLGLDHAAEIAGDLDEIQKSVEAGAADRSMSRGDLRAVSQNLHDIRKYVLQLRQIAAEPATNRPQDTDPGDRRPGGLDIVV